MQHVAKVVVNHCEVEISVARLKEECKELVFRGLAGKLGLGEQWTALGWKSTAFAQDGGDAKVRWSVTFEELKTHIQKYVNEGEDGMLCSSGVFRLFAADAKSAPKAGPRKRAPADEEAKVRTGNMPMSGLYEPWDTVPLA
jgi:hypothetical protein